MVKFKVNPMYQKHKQDDLVKNIQSVKDSEIFFIFGDNSYIKGCRKPQSETIPLINLAKQLNKPFILCLDNSLPLNDQMFLRNLCPNDDTQVFSFNPKLYSDIELHKRMMIILNSAINKEVICDPFKDGK
jgi:hypothetical protein